MQVAPDNPTEFSTGVAAQVWSGSPLGPYFVHRLADDVVVGDFVGPGLVEIGYAIVESCWGRGYATEAVRAHSGQRSRCEQWFASAAPGAATPSMAGRCRSGLSSWWIHLDRRGVVAFLVAYTTHLGPVRAAEAVERFGDRVFDVIRQSPEELCAIRGITPARAQAIHSLFAQVASIANVDSWRRHIGLGKADARRVREAYGDEGELDLLERCLAGSCEFGEGAAQVVRRQVPPKLTGIY